MSKKEQLQQLIETFVANNCYESEDLKEDMKDLIDSIDTLYKVEEWI